MKGLREKVDLKISELKRDDDRDNALRYIRSDACINKQINSYIGYKAIFKSVRQQRLMRGEESDDMSKELEFADFARQYYSRVYTTAHFVAVQKISRLYREILKQRILDREFYNRRMEKINSRK